MKWLPALLIVLFSFAALAADNQSQPAPKPLAATPKPGIVIINGRKFFPLQNVRRFTASAPSQNVLHHPRQKGVIVTRGTKSTLEATDDSAVKAAAAPKEASSDDVLSVFAPEDKSASPALLPKPSPATPLNAPMKQ